MITITLPTVGEVQAEEGMTWAEFCDSEYNPTEPSYGTPLLACSSSAVHWYHNGSVYLGNSASLGVIKVLQSDVLVDGRSYIFYQAGGSDL